MPRLSVPQFGELKRSGQKICVLTAYDFTMARLVDAAGVDAVLVGDTLSIMVQGHENTLPVTLEQMIYHAEIVGRAVERALVVVDMPFLSYQVSVPEAISNAGRILKQCRCEAVKLEGGAEQAETIAALTRSGIPVMAHVGLRPQNVLQMGGYKVQRDAERLLEDARAAEQAGAFSIVLEGIPAELGAKISRELAIPTIGIGAGPECDGQVLVINDLLGLTAGRLPRFVKQYAALGEAIREAAAKYCEEVRSGEFPSAGHSYT